MHPTPRVLIVDDDQEITFVLKEELKASSDFDVMTASNAKEAYSLIPSLPFDVVLLDIQMPRVSGFEVLDYIREHSPSTQVIMFTQIGDIPTAIKSIRRGAYDYVTKPYDPDDLLATLQRAIDHRRLLIEKEVMQNQLDRIIGSPKLISSNQKVKELIEISKKVANTDSFVLIEGASGTGKELFAQLIHRESPRSNQPFVAVNCASIPDTLIENELFGHEKGSFTNAHTTKQGLVEVANRGTLFLDEVGDISSLIQPKLLRFLETGEFRRVGGTTVLRTNVRVISATNKELTSEIVKGKFREDLLYRLKVVSLKLPALVERKEDIPLLAEYFINQKSKTKKLGKEAIELLMGYSWPGNIRELKNVIEGALVISLGETIKPSDFLMNPALSGIKSIESKIIPSVEKAQQAQLSLAQMEKNLIEEVLRANNFNRAKTSKILGISTKTLYLKIQKFKINVPKPF